jgi:hypothetical protein
MLVMGTDENIDYIKGNAGSVPVMPSVPANHIKLCHVLMISGMTEITDAHINTTMDEDRKLTTISITPSSGTGTITAGEFVWHLTNNTPNCNLTVSFLDQYGLALGITDTLTMTKDFGIGQIYSADTGWHASVVTRALTGQTSYAFKYERDQLGTEYSPVFTFVFTDRILQGGYRLQLLNSGGSPIN